MKGTLKNKIFAVIATAGLSVGAICMLWAGSGKWHTVMQAYERDNLDRAAYTQSEDYDAEVEKYNNEIARVQPIANGMLIAGGASFVIAGAAHQINKFDQKKKEEEQTLEGPDLSGDGIAF